MNIHASYINGANAYAHYNQASKNNINLSKLESSNEDTGAIEVIKKTPAQDAPKNNTYATEVQSAKFYNESNSSIGKAIFSSQSNGIQATLQDALGMSDFSSRVQKVNYYKDEFAQNMKTLLEQTSTNTQNENANNQSILKKAIYA